VAVEQLLERIRPFFQAAFEKAAMGEDLIWDITWTTVPTPVGPEIMYLLYVNCAALDQLGLRLQHQFPVPVNIHEDLLDRAVRENVALLLKERTERLKRGHNGQPAGDQPPPGLMMP
jgi:hypothetical protein